MSWSKSVPKAKARHKRLQPWLTEMSPAGVIRRGFFFGRYRYRVDDDARILNDVNLLENILRYTRQMVTQRLSGLDMLRGIAAVIVAYNHAAYLAGASSSFSKSYLAVDFFFLLSGVVIAAAFETRMPVTGALPFLKARWSRLWPLIAFGVMFSAVTQLASGADPYATIACTFLALILLPTPEGAFYMNSPMWSVHFELLANAVHTLFLRRMSVMGLLLVSLACFAIILLTQGWQDLDLGQGDRYLLGVPRTLLSYSLGIVLWRINSAKARGPVWLAFILLPLAILVASRLGWADYVVVLLINPIILLCGLGFDEYSDLAPIARFFGAWSFPLYALHWPIQQLVLKNGQGWIAAFLWSVAASLLIGLMLDRRMRAASLVPWRRSQPSINA